jgi:hypothetical protein
MGVWEVMTGLEVARWWNGKGRVGVVSPLVRRTRRTREHLLGLMTAVRLGMTGRCFHKIQFVKWGAELSFRCQLLYWYGVLALLRFHYSLWTFVHLHSTCSRRLDTSC